MEQYNVEGMSCAACVAHVEKAVRGVDGVSDVCVNLLTNSMTVEGSAASDAICDAVEKAGYHAALKRDLDLGSSGGDFEDTATPKMVRRLLLSVLFLLPILYVSMGAMMWNWPLPSFLDSHFKMGLFEMTFSFIVILINRKFFTSGIAGVLHGAPNMDTLVALGSGISFFYSIYALYAGKPDLYFESAAMILTLITVGKTLESYSKGKTTSALKGLMDLTPDTAVVIVGDEEVTVPVSSLKKGDIFVLRPGMAIPTDGIVIEGESAVDESALTGESIPVDKKEGDGVTGGTMNVSGFLKGRVTSVGSDTTLSKIVQMVSDASATKAPIAKIADKVAGVFVPVVLIIAAVTALVWIFCGAPFEEALTHGITVLVISCPCALGLATPVAIMVGNGLGAKNGILYKTSVALETAGRAQIVVLDKTGTVTTGMPKVTDVISFSSEDVLLKVAYSLEEKSDHPLAKAVCAYADEKRVALQEVTAFENLSGKGLKGTVESEICYGAKEDFIASVVGNDAVAEFKKSHSIDDYLSEGKTPLYFSKGKELLGVIFVADVIKEEAPSAILELKQMGIHTVMLTGDNEKTAASIGKKAGVDEIIANVLPNGKDAVIQKLQAFGKVIMVGDGINDAPALTRADVGFAIGAGTDIAMDAADVVLVNSKLSDVPAAIRLSKLVIRNIHENLFWAFFYNVIGIPLAAGLMIPITGWTLTPMFGAAAMSLSSFCVVMNALRLNLMDIKKAGAFEKQSAYENKCLVEKTEMITEEKNMTKEISINGMMCPNCEKHVRKALESIEGVSEVTKVSHEENIAVVETVGDVSSDVIKAAVEEAGYEFVSVK